MKYCFDNDLGNILENNAWNLEHDAEKLQEILNRNVKNNEHNYLSPNSS